MVGAKAVLVSAVVDSHLDRNGGVNETNNCGGDADEVGVAAVRSAGKAVCVRVKG